MATTFEKLSSNKVKLSFVVAPEKFDEGLKVAYRKIVGRVNIPGFRKGKAPMKIIENYYGSSIFYEDALEAIFPELYQEALKEYDVQVVDRPEIDVEQIGKGQELKFSVEVFVRPDVKLGDYKNLGIEKTVPEVTDDDVCADIERARDRASRYVEVTDRAAKLDDQVNIDYAGFLGEEQFDGGTAQGHDLVLGSGSFIPGFEDQLVGAKVGDELDVNVTFPTEYHSQELAGKPVVFKVKVNAINEKEIPTLDEDFVKEVSETANTVEEYKAEIRAKLEKQAESKADTAFENEVLETVCDNAEIDIPDAMIDSEIDGMLRDMEMRMMYQGMRMEDYYKFTGQTEEQVRGMYKSSAERRVRTQLVIDAIRKSEAIEADEKDIDAEMNKYADQSRKSLDEFKATLSDADKTYFADIAAVQKTIEFLKKNAK
ncbi:MAG: trigger factor [Christensenellales bacterium]|nr:trigger factor [Christensenellales bacterium]